jgi:hypothetical protein
VKARFLVPGQAWKRWYIPLALVLLAAVPVAISADYGGPGGTPIAKTGELDCNGVSPVQQSIKRSLACTDIRGFAGVSNANTWGGRFYDNGIYIGHDEPDMTFFSSKPGSGNNVTWTETLGSDPKALPTVKTPGKDVTHWFELSVAPWFSMDLCDPNSYPQMPCVPNSDLNAPACPNAFGCAPNVYPGGGGAFLELQFYPPGFAPFADTISCDNAHWCAALNVDSLSCTYQFANCNNKCIEPVNFAFIQTDGIPTGPPSPQKATLATFVQNTHTLMMNPGDKLSVHIFDAPAPGGGKALKTVVDDLTTHQTGFMQASAANGFQNTSLIDCSGTPFNYEPEYNTAAQGNIAPWTALQTNISTQFEIGHFEACTTVTNPIFNGAGGASDPVYSRCTGPYEAAGQPDRSSTNPEISDASCFPAGDTHGTMNSAPNLVTGCTDNVFQNGDLDFDGSAYWADWPTGTSPTAKLPSTFRQSPPITNGQQYAAFNFQTDAALSESTCTGSTLSGCAIPPPNAPGKFYPFWSVVSSDNESGDNASASRESGNSGCVIEFGNVTSGEGVNSFGGDAQYGINQVAKLGYPEFESQLYNNTCQ